MKASIAVTVTFVATIIIADQGFYKPLKAENKQLREQHSKDCQNLLDALSEAGRDVIEEKRSGALQSCRFGSTLG